MLRYAGGGALIAHHVEIMNTAAKRTRGLLKFREPPLDYAAIFELPLGGFFPVIHTFGMKFPIDIIFLDHKRVVRAVYKQVEPFRWVVPAKYFWGGIRFVMEVPVSRGHLKIGDAVEWMP